MLGIDAETCTKGCKRGLSMDSRVSSCAGTACPCHGDDNYTDQLDDTYLNADRNPKSAAAGSLYAGAIQYGCVDPVKFS